MINPSELRYVLGRPDVGSPIVHRRHPAVPPASQVAQIDSAAKVPGPHQVLLLAEDRAWLLALLDLLVCGGVWILCRRRGALVELPLHRTSEIATAISPTSAWRGQLRLVYY